MLDFDSLAVNSLPGYVNKDLVSVFPVELVVPSLRLSAKALNKDAVGARASLASTVGPIEDWAAVAGAVC